MKDVNVGWEMICSDNGGDAGYDGNEDPQGVKGERGKKGLDCPGPFRLRGNPGKGNPPGHEGQDGKPGGWAHGTDGKEGQDGEFRGLKKR